MTAWAIEALMGSALLMATVLLIRTPVRRLFGPQVAYALWAIPVLRMLLPPLPAGWRGGALPVLPAAEPVTIYLGHPVAILPAVAAPGDALGWAQALLLLWGAGSVAFLLWQIVGYFRFRHRVLRNGMGVERIGAITIVHSAAASGPLAFGVFDRVVAFPRDFTARFDDDERALALAHELGHHARGDLIANWVGLALLAMHWFNPVAWIAFRAFRADQEMANDAGVLARCGAEARHAYGCAIVKAAHGRAVTAACHLHTIKDLKGRLRMLGMKRASRAQTTAGLAATTLLALGALGLTASGTQAAERMRAGVEDATGVDLAALQPAGALSALSRTAPPPPAAGHRDRTRVTVTRDGHTESYDGPAAEAYLAANPAPVPPMPPVPPVPPMPDLPEEAPVPPVPPMPAAAYARVPVVTEGRCPDAAGETSRYVVQRREGDRTVMTICTDRIERAAQQAEWRSARTRQNALRNALAGMERSRARLAQNRNLTAEQRLHASAGLDHAIAEMREEVDADD